MSSSADQFSVRDYMQGKDLPSFVDESGVRPMPQVKYFGVARSVKGKAYPFVVNDESKIPENCLEVHDCIDDLDFTKKSIWDRARALLDNYEPTSFVIVKDSSQKTQPVQEVVPESPTVKIGAITYHIDNDGGHLALVLSIDNDDCKALFFTSNPLWNRFCRKMTKDEIALAGFVTRKKTTYFAPVVRSIVYFVAYEPMYSFSMDRVNDLLKEFADGFR